MENYAQIKKGDSEKILNICQLYLIKNNLTILPRFDCLASESLLFLLTILFSKK